MLGQALRAQEVVARENFGNLKSMLIAVLGTDFKKHLFVGVGVIFQDRLSELQCVDFLVVKDGALSGEVLFKLPLWSKDTLFSHEGTVSEQRKYHSGCGACGKLRCLNLLSSARCWAPFQGAVLS